MMLLTTLRRAGALLLLALALAFGLPAAAQAAAPGVNIDSPSDQRVDAALATGAKLVRLFVSWSQLQPTRDSGYPASDPGAANAAAGFDNAIKRLNAAGAKPMFVILSTPSWANGSDDQLVPPKDPQDYADFFAKFVRHSNAVGDVASYEVWNEEDAEEFWHGPNPGAAAYAPMLKAAYDAAAPVKGNAAILVGPTTGNNANFIQGLYDQGAKGKFDGVAVHTDTACLGLGPDFYYREDPNDRIGQFSFLGYRSVRQVMLANQDSDPKIWMTELGWSSTGGGATSCERGTGAGKRASGVSEAAQAEFLTQAFGCLAQDSYVVAASWFTLNDRRDLKPDELNHYGLIGLNGQPKPSYAAFKKIAAANGGAAGPCGDFTAPKITIITPTPNLGYTGRLLIQASAVDGSDPGVKAAGLSRLSFRVDGNPQAIGNFPATDGKVVQQDYFGASKLADGKHTLTVIARDTLGNQSTASVDFYKGAQYVKTSVATGFTFPKGKNPTCIRRTCTFKGKLNVPANVAPSGRVRVEWQLFVRQRVKSKVKGKKAYKSSWITFHKGGASPKTPFAFKQKLARGGKWRVRVSYPGAPPLKKTVSPWKTFTVR